VLLADGTLVTGDGEEGEAAGELMMKACEALWDWQDVSDESAWMLLSELVEWLEGQGHRTHAPSSDETVLMVDFGGMLVPIDLCREPYVCAEDLWIVSGLLDMRLGRLLEAICAVDVGGQ
jgi:hypothetical protein